MNSNNNHKPRKKNTAIIALFSGIFVVGIAVLMISVFHPFETPSQPENNGGYSQDKGNGGTQPNEEPPNKDDTFREDMVVINGQPVYFRDKDGRKEYSTDDGKTWSENPPGYVPPQGGNGADLD